LKFYDKIIIYLKKIIKKNGQTVFFVPIFKKRAEDVSLFKNEWVAFGIAVKDTVVT